MVAALLPGLSLVLLVFSGDSIAVNIFIFESVFNNAGESYLLTSPSDRLITRYPKE